MIVRMSLDFAECDRARLARDAAYDGRFYTGVHTTGIYCRPVCPVRPARSGNVSFFPSAAAAEMAGFRPCLRCRPETAPFCSAWIGSRATVERGLRLIVEEGALDQEGATVERLAQRLGVGSRQLTRLFARYLQASPSKVARTARVQRAKRLLDETSLPMTEIAIQAGFGSLRRFNSVFAEIYGRPPSEIRRARRSAGGEERLAPAGRGGAAALRYRPPPSFAGRSADSSLSPSMLIVGTADREPEVNHSIRPEPSAVSRHTNASPVRENRPFPPSAVPARLPAGISDDRD
jgi:AraC family transcriptional regulator of adaptative response / DNA-3-methyladenine glycosylase II